MFHSGEERLGSTSEPLTARVSNHKSIPVFSIVTRWDKDPYAFGSYSFLPVGCSYDIIKEFRKPEKLGTNCNVLFFAGEHVARPEEGWQCVDGEYDFGLIAAHNLLV